MSRTTSDVWCQGAGPEGAARSALHRMLASERRRIALDLLQGRTAPVDLTALAAGVAAREAGASAVDEGTIERVAVSLHHAHLPLMAGEGVLEYDADARRVVSCPGRPTRQPDDSDSER